MAYLSYSQHFPGVSAQNRGCKVALDACVLVVSSDNASACKYEFVIKLTLKFIILKDI